MLGAMIARDLHRLEHGKMHNMMVFWFLCIALLACQSIAGKFVNWSTTHHMRGRKYSQPFDVSLATKGIQIRLSKELIPTSQKVAAIVVFSFPLFANGTHPRLPALRCSLHKLYINVAQYTPMDLYLFMNDTTIQYVPSWIYDVFPGVTVVSIDRESWQIPAELSPTSEWMYGKAFKEGYHLMGRWRLTYAPAFARSLGYRYMLFADDDALVVQPIDQNLVELCDTHKVALVHRNKVLLDIPAAITGIAELARYWMVTRNVSEPFGPLFEHLTPPNMEGLTTAGWDKHTFQSAFMVLNLDFWYEEPVQDFLDLVLSTGGDLMQRWLEQGVMNLVKLMFLTVEQVLLLPQTAVLHDKVVDPRIFRLLQCEFVTNTPLSTAVTAVTSNVGTGTSVSTDGSTGLTIAAPRTSSPADINSLPKIEFLIVWENTVVVPVATQKLKELFLFHWVYNLTSCGADTATLNDYKQYLEQADQQKLRMYWWWHEFEVDAKLDVILGRGNATTATSVSGTGNTVSVEKDARNCVLVLRQQLVEYVTFYCAYTGIHQGKPMGEYCSSIEGSVLNAYDAL